MHAKGKTKEELLDEIRQLRSTIASLEEAKEAFLQSTPDEILLIQPDYTIRFANRHFQGVHPEKIVGRPFFEMLEQDEAQKFKEILNTVFSDAAACECELSFGPRVYAARVTPIRENGRVTSALVVARDFTDFKQTERALRESEARYRDLLERVPDGIYRSTPEGKFLMVNSALVRMLGYESHEELLKIDIPSELYFDPRERREAQDRLTHQQQQSHIIRLRRKDGSTLWVEDHGRLEYDDQGKPLYFEGVLRDVTASRKVEVELKKSEQRYRMLIERMHEGLMQVDNDDVIQFVNDRFCELTGYSRKELVGQVAHQLLLRKEDHEFLKSKIRERLRRKHDEYELRIRKKSGELIWVHTSGTPIFDERGEVVGSLGIHADITQRKRMEEALQKSQERYRSFFDGDLSADFVSAPDGRLLDCNQAFVEMFGFSSKEEALNTNANLLYPEESSRLEYIKLLQKQREIHNYERELVKLDGCRIHVVSNIKGIFNEQDELVEIRGYIFDITEKKQAEALSSAQKQILELIAGDVSLSVVLNTLCLTIERNAPGTLCSIMLVDESGKRMRCGAAPSLPEAYAAALEGMLVADNSGSCGTAAFLGKQVVVTNVESDPRWENFRKLAREYGIRACWSSPLFSKSGKVLGTFAISHKTPCSPSPFHEELMKTASHLAGIAVEHAQSEEALRRSEQRFRDLFDNAPDMYIILDPNAVVVDFNQRGLRKLGYTREDIIGKSITDYIHPDDLPKAGKVMEFIHSTGRTPSNIEIRLLPASGEPIYVSKEFSLLHDEKGALKAVRVVCRDITQSKRLKEELARSQRLKSAGRVAGQIAHDFNNLLAPLTAYPALICEDLPADHPVVEMVKEMETAAKKIAEINQQLLALGRRGHYRMENIDLNELMEHVLFSAGVPKDVVVQTEFAPNLFPIKGGAAQLTRALTNIVLNAIEAMDGMGVLSIKTENVYLDEPLGSYQTVEMGEYVKLAIADTGTGIEQAVLDRIFEPFFTTKQMDRMRGSGLGLSVVHGIVQDHRGYICIDSKAGQGTTFALYFPITRESDLGQETTEAAARGNGETILVVDDDLVQRKVARQLLSRFGYRIETATSGEEAVAAVKQHPFDLLVLDMVMSGIDGAETYRQIQEINPKQKAIILSGYAMSQRVEEALRLGAETFVSKPIEKDSLLRAVRQAFESDGEHATNRPTTDSK